MNTLAVVLTAPEDLAVRHAWRSDAPGPSRYRRRCCLERHQHRHRAPALVRPHAAVPRHGLSAGARLRIGRPGRSRLVPSPAVRVGDTVFVPGANCFGPVRGLVRRRCVPPGRAGRARATLHFRVARRTRACCWPSPPPRNTRWPVAPLPELIVGHGVLGRVLARLTVLAGGTPTVWERNPARHGWRAKATPSAPPTTTPAAITPRFATSAVTRRSSTSSSPAWHPAARSCLPGSTANGSASRSRPPSCARPASASPRNGSPPTWPPSPRWPRPGRCRWTAADPWRACCQRPAAYRTAFEDAGCLKMLLDWKGCS